MLVVGTAVGAALAFIAFAISAFRSRSSCATMSTLHGDGDQRSYGLPSPRTDAPLGWLIAVLIAFGIATMFVGLIVVFPLVGHATWHAYRALVKGEALISAIVLFVVDQNSLGRAVHVVVLPRLQRPEEQRRRQARLARSRQS